MSAVRVLFDHLLEKGAVESNPAARTKAPRLKRETSHTPVFEEQEIQAFLDSIQLRSLIDVRDKALFTTLLYTWARVSALSARDLVMLVIFPPASYHRCKWV